MKLDHPHIITEGNLTYRLGELSGNSILYDFDKMLIYLEAKGKLMFGERFRIYKEDRGILLKLCNYIIKDYDSCKKDGIDPNKGLLLSGPVGCGKTSLMRLLKFLVPYQNRILSFPAEISCSASTTLVSRLLRTTAMGSTFVLMTLGWNLREGIMERIAM